MKMLERLRLKRYSINAVILAGISGMVVTSCCFLSIILPVITPSSPQLSSPTARLTFITPLSPEKTPTTTRLPATQIAAHLPELPTYKQMASDLEGMTDAQRNAYLSGMKGRRVTNWRGRVCDVSEFLGVYTIQISVDNGEDDTFVCTTEVRVNMPKDAALQYHKDQPVEFSGVVRLVSEGLFSGFYLTLQDATFK